MTIDDRERANETLNELRKALDDFRTGVVRTHNETLAALDEIRNVMALLRPAPPDVELRGSRVTIDETGTTFRCANGNIIYVPRRSSQGEFARYGLSVLTVAQRLNAHASGTGDTLRDAELEELLAWLTWRVGPKGWLPTRSGGPADARADILQSLYDDAVRQLALAALAQIRGRRGSQ